MTRMEQATFVQSVLTSAAIIVGGGWALFAFVSSQSSQAIVNTELLKEHCLARGVLDINIVDNSKSYSLQKGLIIGQVEIKNVGTRPVTVHLASPPIRIAKVEFASDGKVTQQTISGGMDIEFYRAPSVVPITKEVSPATEPISEISVLPGRTAREPFIVKVLGNNWYMVDFWGGHRDIWNEDSYCKKYGDDRTKGYAWEATAIFHVD